MVQLRTVNRVVVGVSLVLGVIWAGRWLVRSRVLDDCLDFIGRMGVMGPVLFIVLNTVLSATFLPAVALTMGSGLIWGWALGTVVAVAAAAASAATCMYLGKYYFGKQWVTSLTARFPLISAIDRAIQRRGWLLVFLLRLSPIAPFPMISYALSMTQVRFWSYWSASVLGVTAPTAMYVYIGSLSRQAHDALQASQAEQGLQEGSLGSSGHAAPPEVSPVILIVSVLVTLVLGAVVSLVAARAIRHEMRHVINSDDEAVSDGDGDGANGGGGGIPIVMEKEPSRVVIEDVIHVLQTDSGSDSDLI